jgi:hypothetical protein
MATGVDDPSKDGFARRPIGVALEHLFNRGELIVAKDAVSAGVYHRAKNLIHGGKQDAADAIQMGGGTLGSADKVVNKNMNCGKLPGDSGGGADGGHEAREWATEEAECEPHEEWGSLSHPPGEA